MERGEIWLVSLDPTAGHEQQGTRPVLIVTPAAFNRVTRLPVVLSESRLGSMPSNELRAAVLREIGCSDSTYNRVYSELVKSGEIAKHQINQGGNVRSWFTAMPYRGETSDKVAKL